MRYLLILCLAVAASPALAETYKWTENGKTIISDTPPPGKAKTLVKTEETAEAGDNLPFATKRAAEA
nr:DUF4124 domain-containing protein [Rhodocyclaceae bacterium]